MEKEVIDNDFTKRVASELVLKLKTITKNEEDIRTFLLSITKIFVELKRNKDIKYYDVDNILLFLKEKGLIIPKSMQKRIDEYFIYSLFGCMDNVLLEQLDDLTKSVETLVGKTSKQFYPEFLDKLAVKLIENMEFKTIYLNYDSSSQVLYLISKLNNSVKYLCQCNNKYDEEILKLESQLLKIKDIEIENGSTILNSKFVGKNRFDCAIIQCLNDTSLTNEEYEKIRKSMNKQKEIYKYGEASQNSPALIAIQQTIHSLNENGKAVLIVPSGILFKEGKDKEVRKNLIKSDNIETVIQLPIIKTVKTNISPSIIVLNKGKKNVGKIRMLNLQDIKDYDCDKILEKYNSEEEKVFVDIEEIKKKNFNLNMEIYTPVKKRIIKTTYFSDVKVDTMKINEILDEKRTVELGLIAEIYKGPNILKKHDKGEGKYSILNMSALKDGEIDYSDIIKSNLEDFRTVPEIEKGDILLSCKGSAVKIAIVDREVHNYTVTQNTMIIRAKYLVDQKFLEAYLNSPFGRYLISKAQKGDRLLMISLKDLQNIPVIIPPIHEQYQMIEEYEEQEIKLRREMEEISNKIKENRRKLYKKMGIDNSYDLSEEKSIVKEK